VQRVERRACAHERSFALRVVQRNTRLRLSDGGAIAPGNLQG
jgi:hypothetical protein